MRVSAVRVWRSIRGVSFWPLRLRGTKPRARVSPLLETRAVIAKSGLKFEEHADQNVIVRFKRAKLLGQPADFVAALGRQFGLPLSQLRLLGLDRCQSGCIVSHFSYLRFGCFF
ncbi:MAG: hypothetical protein ACREQI_11665 [Candidatus Binataceae bacterium]